MNNYAIDCTFKMRKNFKNLPLEHIEYLKNPKKKKNNN